MNIHETISGVEHHPAGLILLLSDGEGVGTPRTDLFLTGATFEPKRDDVVMIRGSTGTILTGEAEHHVAVKGNQLTITDPPEDTHGCA